MTKPTPQNLTRTFKDRSIGICRKAAKLHAIDSSIRISIIIEKPGQQPFVFSCEEQGFQWPTFMEQYVDDRAPIVKRPSHFVSLNEGLSRGRVKAVKSSPSPFSSPRPQTPESNYTLEGKKNEDDLDDLGHLSLRRFPTPYASPSRNPSLLPPRTAIVLPSKRRRLESDDGNV